MLYMDEKHWEKLKDFNPHVWCIDIVNPNEHCINSIDALIWYNLYQSAYKDCHWRDQPKIHYTSCDGR